MTSTTPSTTFTTDRPAGSGRRRRQSAPSELEALFVETDRWRKVVVWRYARWTLDAHETAAAAVWEQIVAGERDHRALYAAARRALMRLRRYEQRHRRRALPDEHLGEDPAERVAEIVDAERLAALVAPPPAPAREWIDRKTTAVRRAPLSSTEKSAGQRWASKARTQIGTVDAAA